MTRLAAVIAAAITLTACTAAPDPAPGHCPPEHCIAHTERP